MKRTIACFTALIIMLLASTSALAWGSSTPPRTSNIGSLSKRGVLVKFGSKGILKYIDTDKCYNGIRTYKVKATGLYLAENNPRKCTVELSVNYWNTSAKEWQKGDYYRKTLPKTNVKDSRGNYHPAMQSISTQYVSAHGKVLYHYGVFRKDYHSLRLYGSFILSK